MTPRGRFIVLEGVEGCGKSTHVRLLDGWLSAHGRPHVVTREPGGTPLGEQVRGVLLDSEEVAARAELLLMLAARAALVDEVVTPALGRGEIVIADRYEMSSLAYQGGGRGLSWDEVRGLNSFATGGLRPDLTILLDVPASISAERRHGRPGGGDRIERAGAAFHGRVAAAYRLLGSEPGVEVVDATPAIDVVQRQLRMLLATRYPETFPRSTG
jgi:dTMP kinase